MEYIKNILVYIIPSLVVCIFYNILIKNFNLKKDRENILYSLLFTIITIYLSLLLSSLISPVYGFSTVINWSQNLNMNLFRISDTILDKPILIIKSIIIFIPYGFFLPLLCKRIDSNYKVILCGVILSTLIEIFQLFLYKATDIDHILLASLGTCIGYIVYKFLASILKVCKFHLYTFEKGVYYKVKEMYIYILLIFISVICSGFYINLKNFDDIEASNACLLDVNDKNIIYSKGCDEKIAPASTAKMITALTVLDYCNINEKVTVGNEIKYVYEDASRAGLSKGDKLTIKQLLDGLLLPSGNDAAYVLARYTGEKLSKENISIEDAIATFMSYANEKAEALGANNSRFIRPDGYDTKNQYTTAKDLACIGEEFMKSSTLSSIVKNYKVEDKLIDGGNITYENTNELVNPYSEYYYSDIKGLKTGSSSSAGKCVVSAAEINEKTYICVVMGSTDEGRWLDSLCLYQSIK